MDLFIDEGEALGLVGESGCGKSTLGRAIVRLERPSAGSISFGPVELTRLKGRALRRQRRGIQMVFQDSSGSLNPRHTVQRTLSEPLVIAGIRDESERVDRIGKLLERVGLNPKLTSRPTDALSGGQRQRVGIARALSVEPRLLICDEPTSSLDVSFRAQVLNVFQDLKEEGLALLFISHDLSSVRQLADRVAVMYSGKIVEVGDSNDIYRHPTHPYTRALLGSVPDPDQPEPSSELILEGEPPSPRNIPSGCRFRTRCPYVQDVCVEDLPVLREARPGQLAACHLFEDLPPW